MKLLMMTSLLIKNMHLVWCFLWMVVESTSSYIIPSATPTMPTEVGEDLCAVKSPLVPKVISPWLETSQRAEGCSVPYRGAQGHGQHPEEVHVIHLTEVGMWNPNESDKPRAVVKLRLDAASCPKSVMIQKSPGVRRTRQADANFHADEHNSLDEQHLETKQHTLHRIHRVADIPVEDTRIRHERSADSLEPPASMVALLGQGIGQQERKNISSDPFLKGRPLILVLLTDQSVVWQIKLGDCWHKQLASNIQVVVNRGSTVEADFLFEVSHKVWGNKLNRKFIQRFVRRTYHGVASYTEIHGANFIRVRVGAGGPADTETNRRRAGLTRNKMNSCDFNFNFRQKSLTVSALHVVMITAQGCTNGEHEQDQLNVYVVDMGDEEILPHKSVQRENNEEITTKPKNLSSVVIVVRGHKRLLSENGTGFIPDFDVQNISVILRSKMPVRWLVHTDEVLDKIVVVSDPDSVVENAGVGTSGGLEVKVRALPHSRSALSGMILTEFGTPVLYTRIGHATGLTLHVSGNPEKEYLPDAIDLVNFTTDKSPGNLEVAPVQKKSRRPSFLLPPLLSIEHQPPPFDSPITSTHDGKRHRVNRLEANMTVHCGKSHVEVAFPVHLLLELGVQHLHLTDHSCLAHYNRTHASISSPITSCGSTSHSDGKTTAFSNYVHVKFIPPTTDDEDVEGSGTSVYSVDETEHANRIPIVCRYEPILSSDVLDEEKDDMVVEENHFGGAGELFGNAVHADVPSLYKLELYRDPLLYHAVGSKFADSPGIQVDFNEAIYVQAWMDGAASVQVVIENCWMSNYSQAEGGTLRDRVVLIRGSCPFHHSVKLGQEFIFPGSRVIRTEASTFSFRVNEDYARLGQVLFMHCLIGVCASKPKHTRGNLVLCVDPQQFCSQRAVHSPISKALPAAQQLLSRGPIIIPQKKYHTTHVNAPNAVNCAGMGFLSPEDIEVVITTDLVVTVAVCSFIMGVVLTAALWFIHSRTDPLRRRLHSGDHSLVSRSAATSSSLSPHSHSGCSSVNSQSAITT